MKLTALLLASLSVGCAATTTAPRSELVPAVTPIAKAEVEVAQREWCKALLSIAKASGNGQDPAPIASNVLDAAYGYADGTVLFKPTLTHGVQTFRFDKRGALAYFVGGDAAYPDDKGFARKPWTSCTPQVAAVYATGDHAIAMGKIALLDREGSAVMVDKTFGYRRDKDGALRIVLHHSSLEYSPPTTAAAAR